MEHGGQAQDAFDDVEVFRIVVHGAHETAVYLQGLDGQVAQVGQRGVAGAEVVQGAVDADAVAGVYHFRHLEQVRHRARFEDLQLQRVGTERRIGRQPLGQGGHEVILLQLVRAYVDADGQVQAARLPGGGLLQGRVDDPAAQLQADRLIVDHGDELGRLQQAAARMLPAQQRLDADQGARAQVDLGLVVQLELALRHGLAHFLQVFELALEGFVMLDVEQVEAVLAGQLGLVHGLVGVAQQLVGARFIGREQGDADAGRQLQGQPVQFDRRRHGLQQAFHHRFELVVMFQVHQQGDEFIAAQAGDGVLLAQGRLHARGAGDQQGVAHAMAVLVVDGLEAVEVEEDDGQRPLLALALRQRLLQPVQQQDPVGQAGQGVEMGDVLERVLALLQLGDVGEDGDVIGNAVGVVAHGAYAQHGHVFGAVLTRATQLAGPVGLFGHGAPHGVVAGLRVVCGLQEAGMAAQYFGPAVAGDAGKGVVDVDQAAFRVGDHDAFAGVGEHAGVQLQPGRGRLLFRDVDDDGAALQSVRRQHGVDLHGTGQAAGLGQLDFAPLFAAAAVDLRQHGAECGAVGQDDVAVEARADRAGGAAAQQLHAGGVDLDDLAVLPQADEAGGREMVEVGITVADALHFALCAA